MNKLMYAFWDGSWPSPPNGEGVIPNPPGGLLDGNPVVLSAGGDNWEVYPRDDGQIKYTTWVSPTYMTDWDPLPGVIDEAPAASYPAVVATDSQHILVFYRDTNGHIRFTERQGGVWRDKPLALLDGDEGNNLFLPLVGNGKATSLSSPQSVTEKAFTSRDTLTTAQPAASRNANHAVVFYVDEQNQLWINE